MGCGGGSTLTHWMPSGSSSKWRVISSAVGIASERTTHGASTHGDHVHRPLPLNLEARRTPAPWSTREGDRALTRSAGPGIIGVLVGDALVGEDRCSWEGGDLSDATTRSSKHPPRWFVHTAWRVHLALYRLSGGRFLWTTSNKRGWGALRLTTIGRQSGTSATSTVGYIEDGPILVTLAMNGFDEGDPRGGSTFQAHQRARSLDRRHPRPVRARSSVGQERERLWQCWVSVDPHIEVHAGRRSTETPVVVLEPRDAND